MYTYTYTYTYTWTIIYMNVYISLFINTHTNIHSLSLDVAFFFIFLCNIIKIIYVNALAETKTKRGVSVSTFHYK